MTNFELAVRRAAKAAHGDSNDSEIELLWDAVDEACRRLKVDLSSIRRRASDAAEKAELKWLEARS